ncbi:MAG: hypothetical protein BWY69_01497 [Planctomycetes bacterium ADurb.Bin401]|nr:MAG: hypothetical protein BWY69_01497 [Planctomycetes bacterium ADurb.Bin401]
MNSVAKKMKKAFTLTELLVAIGLLAAVLTASTIIFHYSIEAHRTAMATAEIMHSVRAITDQLNLQLAGLRKDGCLMIGASTNGSNNLKFFSVGDFQSSFKDDVRSNIAWMYFGPAENDSNNLLLDIKLLTPGESGVDVDYEDKSFIQYQEDIINGNYPDAVHDIDLDNPYNLLAQRISDIEIEWTDGSVGAVYKNILWQGSKTWEPTDNDWPKALKFRFTIHDSKNILKGGKTFEHIVYIGN